MMIELSRQSHKTFMSASDIIRKTKKIIDSPDRDFSPEINASHQFPICNFACKQDIKNQISETVNQRLILFLFH